MKRILLSVSMLALTTAQVHAEDYAMVCTPDAEFAYQSTRTNGTTEINKLGLSAFGNKVCPVSLTFTNGGTFTNATLHGYEECGAGGRFEKKFEVIINHADNLGMPPGEVTALKRMGIFETQLWAVSFNRKEVAVASASSDIQTMSGMQHWHCQ